MHLQTDRRTDRQTDGVIPVYPPNFVAGGIKTTTLVRDHEHFIPTKFRKHPLSGSVVKADYVFPYMYMH